VAVVDLAAGYVASLRQDYWRNERSNFAVELCVPDVECRL
jgi:hypothetical protein